MNNQAFLTAIKRSFDDFIISGTSRSTAKLKPLHGAIARDLLLRLGPGFSIKSQGIGDDREGKIQGRYIDKCVDITIYQHNRVVAGIAVKFVMQNYSQNSNNYFENMLGETANIRSNGIPYFQVFIILDKLPYYNRQKEITKWESFTEHNISKYVALSQDNIDDYRHTPNKTLIYVVHVPDCDMARDSDDYLSFYRDRQFAMIVSRNHYHYLGPAVILNDYESFAEKVYHTIMAL